MERTEELLAFSVPETLHLQVSASRWSVAFIDQARSLVATACQRRLQLTVVQFLHPRGWEEEAAACCTSAQRPHFRMMW